MLITAYGVALEGLPMEAVMSVVSKLVKGIWPDPVKFVPWPPEFAAMVRREDARIRDLRTGHNDNTPVRNPPMVERVKAKFRGKQVLSTGVTMADARSGKWPVGSVYVPALETMFAADPVVEKGRRENPSYTAFKQALAETRKRVSEVLEGDDIERMRKILSLPVRPDARDDELRLASTMQKRIEGSRP